jgi:hypothetical protein
MPLSQRRQVDAVAVPPSDHRKAGETAFGRLGLQNKWRSATDYGRSLQHAVGKFHALPLLKHMRGTADVV